MTGDKPARTTAERQRAWRERHSIQSLDIPGEVAATLRAIRDRNEDPSMTAAAVRLIRREAKRLGLDRSERE